MTGFFRNWLMSIATLFFPSPVKTSHTLHSAYCFARTNLAMLFHLCPQVRLPAWQPLAQSINQKDLYFGSLNPMKYKDVTLPLHFLHNVLGKQISKQHIIKEIYPSIYISIHLSIYPSICRDRVRQKGREWKVRRGINPCCCSINS